jgi:hypothetical protein
MFCLAAEVTHMVVWCDAANSICWAYYRTLSADPHEVFAHGNLEFGQAQDLSSNTMGARSTTIWL